MTERAPLSCCIAGGGPAGLMLGVLLARAGVRVRVLEKHDDFLRDFRGDTIHPSTLELVHELGWLERFLELPHQKVPRIRGIVAGQEVDIADFSHLPVTSPYIAMMPQWDFLSFLAGEGARYPGFALDMGCKATDLIEEGGRVVGLAAEQGGERLELRADLVVAADGRGSTLRERSGLRVEDLGAPMDVLWFRVPRREGDDDRTLGRFEAGHVFIRLFRGDYWQCASVIPKGALEQVRERGLEAFRAEVTTLSGLPPERLAGLTSWDPIKLLQVRVDRLKRWWRPGLLCIGDAAHAMSPIGGVGINLAVQDAVATANLLAGPLLERRLDDSHLQAVERRRRFPTRVTQALQLVIQNRIIAPTLRGATSSRPPLPVRLAQRFPVLQRLPASVIGLGLRPEHVSARIREGKG